MQKRKIPKNYRNVTGLAYSEKSEDKVGFESTLERDFYRLLEFDNNVRRYDVQPVTFNYCFKGKVRKYTPDVLVDYADQITILFEVKYRQDLKDNWLEYRPKFKAAIGYAKRNGMRFKLISEYEIRTPYLDNVKFLLSFRRNNANEAHEVMLVRRLKELCETTPEVLLLAVFRDHWSRAELIPSLWRLVALGVIEADLNTPISMSTKIWSVA